MQFSILFPPFTYLYFQPSFVWHPFLYQGGGNWTLTTYCAINNQLQRGTPNAIEMIKATNFLFLNLFFWPFSDHCLALSSLHWLTKWFLFLRLDWAILHFSGTEGNFIDICINNWCIYQFKVKMKLTKKSIWIDQNINSESSIYNCMRVYLEIEKNINW